jgi:dephospho-CoA kinase
MAYEKGTEAYKKVVEAFGTEILDADQLIDRKRLGGKVFNSASELKKLTDIVWPEIQALVDQQVEDLFSKGYRIIVVEAALLIDASWHKKMNEIWVCFVPEEEAIERAVRRDGSSVEKVKGILGSQLSNKERIGYANVVFSSLWEREYTLGQVKKAWKNLVERTVGSQAVRSSL